MPTITMSWTDLALVALTAGVIGGVALAGAQIRPSISSLTVPASNDKSRGSKKKKARAKKAVVTDSPQSSSTPSASSPAPSLNETKMAEAVSMSKSAKKKAREEPRKLDDKAFPPLVPSVVSSNVSQAISSGVRPESNVSQATRPLAERKQPQARKTKVDDMS